MFDIDSLRGGTYATIRAAFNTSTEIMEEYGDAGHSNVSSIMTKIMQDVGRFSERHSSDAFFGLEKLYALAHEEYRVDPENPFDEIFCFGIRQDGVDHSDWVMDNLAKCRDHFTGYVFPERHYRRVLAVRCRAAFDKDLRCTRARFSLRDITHAFHAIEPADLKENGIDVINLPYEDRHEPEITTEYRKLDKTDIEKAKQESLKKFTWEEASEKEYADLRKNGCAGEFKCYIVAGTHDDPVLLPDEKPEEVCRVFVSDGASVATWTKPGYEYYNGARDLVTHITLMAGFAEPILDTSGSM